MTYTSGAHSVSVSVSASASVSVSISDREIFNKNVNLIVVK